MSKSNSKAGTGEQLDSSTKIDTPPHVAASSIYDWRAEQASQEHINSLISDYKSNADEFVKLLPPGGKIFELGSGIGTALNYFHNLGFDVFGIDVSSKMVNLAKIKFPHIKVEQRNFQDIKFLIQPDGIYEKLSLMNLPKLDIQKVFEKVYGALKPNGVFQCSFEIKEPQYTGWHYIPMETKLMPTGAEISTGEYLYLSYFLEKELIDILESFHFKILKTTVTNEPDIPYKIITVLCQKTVNTS